MSAPAISPAPWDLRSGEKWEIRSADRDQYGDHNSEVVVDAKGNVVAYVSGFNDEGGNGQLLAAAALMAETLRQMVQRHDRDASETVPGFQCGCKDCMTATGVLRKAGAL